MLPIIDVFASFDKLYNMVRNYITKKPYSAEKIKLNFSLLHPMQAIIHY